MKYFDALKLWNSHKRTCDTTHCWIAPKKGTQQYQEIRFIMRNERLPKAGEDLSEPKKQRKPRQKKTTVAPPPPKIESPPASPKAEAPPKAEEKKENRALKMEIDRFYTAWYLAQEAAKGIRKITIKDSFTFHLAGEKETFADLDSEDVVGQVAFDSLDTLRDIPTETKIEVDVEGNDDDSFTWTLKGSNYSLGSAFGYLALTYGEAALKKGGSQDIIKVAQKYDEAMQALAKKEEKPAEKKEEKTDDKKKLLGKLLLKVAAANGGLIMHDIIVVQMKPENATKAVPEGASLWKTVSPNTAYQIGPLKLTFEVNQYDIVQFVIKPQKPFYVGERPDDDYHLQKTKQNLIYLVADVLNGENYQGVISSLANAKEDVPEKLIQPLKMLLWKQTSYKEVLVPVILPTKSLIVSYNPFDKDYQEFKDDFKPYVGKAFAIKRKGKTLGKLFFDAKYGVPVVFLQFLPAVVKTELYPDAEEREEAFTYDNGKPLSEEDTIIRLVGAIGSVMD